LILILRPKCVGFVYFITNYVTVCRIIEKTCLFKL
jgi:hypothetical protein